MKLLRILSAPQLIWKYQNSFSPCLHYCLRFKKTVSKTAFHSPKCSSEGLKISKGLSEDLLRYSPVQVRQRDIKGTTRWIAIPLVGKKNVFNVVHNSLLTEIQKAPEVYQHSIFMSEVNYNNMKCNLIKKVEFKTINNITDDLLCLFQLGQQDFTPKIKRNLPSSDWKIPPEEFKIRETFNDECIFTIDPPTAKDLDDAIHVKLLPDYQYEIGVHVADVSYFVKENSDLDQEASRRSTSIYMADKVIPMLPEILSEKLCSLSPECEKLAMTCFITLDINGNILDHKFKRTIIHSAARLSYTAADKLIQLSKQVRPSELTEQHLVDLCEPKLTQLSIEVIKKILSSLEILAMLSDILRRKRVKQGALSLEKTELEFEFSESSSNADKHCYPVDFKIKSRGTSSFLIEELMLLANQVAAMNLVSAYYGSNFVYKKRQTFIKRGSFLRRHPPPQEKKLMELKKTLSILGYNLDVKNPASLSKVLLEIENESNEKTSPSLKNALYFMTYFRMQMALYFCLEHDASEMDYDHLMRYAFHYGLSTPLYTHFTSPIRRYADLVVHRKLMEIHYAQSKTEQNTLPISLFHLKSAALISNHKRLSSRKAKFLSDTVYLAALLKKSGPVNMLAYVVNIKEFGLQVLFGDIGIARFLRIDSGNKTKKFSISLLNKTDAQLLWVPQNSCSHSLSLKLSFLDPLSFSVHCQSNVLDVTITPNRPLCPVCDKDLIVNDSIIGVIVDTTADNKESEVNSSGDEEGLAKTSQSIYNDCLDKTTDKVNHSIKDSHTIKDKLN